MSHFSDPVSLPLWAFWLIFILAIWSFLSRLLVPGVRWFFRRRLNIVIRELNDKLDLSIPAFKLTKRKILIDRLIYDPEVVKAAEEFCRENEASNEVAMEKVGRYAKEIVPSFNAYFYFRIGSWLSKSVLKFLYRVRIGFSDEKGLAAIDPNSSVVFVMNHRSNMDYILLAHMAVEKAALSYAVGEWARVWPIQQLIRSMGGFFVRRNSGNTLYRRVLARYVQMATESGVVQAMYPEGGLSKDGYLREPKIGLIDYMLRGFDPNGERDLVFIPVAVNYDRVLEDRTLLLKLDKNWSSRPKLNPLMATFGFIGHNLMLMLRGGWYRFGYTAVNFGTPVSTKEYLNKHHLSFQRSDKTKRVDAVKNLAGNLMEAIGDVVPVLPVSLLATFFVENPKKQYTEYEIHAGIQTMIDTLEAKGAHVYIPRDDRLYTIGVGLRMLTLRHFVLKSDDRFQANPDEMTILKYYANSIRHLWEK